MINRKLIFFIVIATLFFTGYLAYKSWTYVPEQIELSQGIYASQATVYDLISAIEGKTNWMPWLREINVVTNEGGSIITREVIQVENRSYTVDVYTVSNITHEWITYKRIIPQAQEAFKTYLLIPKSDSETQLVIKQRTKYLHPLAKSSATLLDQMTLEQLNQEVSSLKEYAENIKVEIPLEANFVSNTFSSSNLIE